jgi:hypothetical protein
MAINEREEVSYHEWSEYESRQVHPARRMTEGQIYHEYCMVIYQAEKIVKGPNLRQCIWMAIKRTFGFPA